MDLIQLLSAIFTLTLVMDPLGNIPLFVAALKTVPEEKKKQIIIREMFIALAIMLFFLLFGKSVLSLLSLDLTAMTVAGGIVLFLIALQMIFPGNHSSFGENTGGEPFIVPLAIPLVAGPSTLTTILIFSMKDPGAWPVWLIMIVASWLINVAILSMASKLSKILGEKGLLAMEKLMGMILITISVQMVMMGIKKFFFH